LVGAGLTDLVGTAKKEEQRGDTIQEVQSAIMLEG